MRAAATKTPVPVLFVSAVPAALVSITVPTPATLLSAVIVTSKVPAPLAPSGSVIVAERSRASPAATGVAAAPVNETAVSSTTAPGVPSPLRWRTTT